MARSSVVLVGVMILLGVGGEAGARTQAAPAEVVLAYYQAIASYDYGRAYAYLGEPLRRQQTLDRFTAGFAETAYVEVHVVGVAPASGGDAVEIRLTAWHNDRTIHQFDGSYTVGPEGGAEKLVAAAIREVATPVRVPPLCRSADLAATSAADAGAGNRFATVTLTNGSAGTCVLGGYPYVELRDANGTALIGSAHEPERPISTVTLQPGRAATFDLRWSNWCGRQPAALTALVIFPGDTVNRLPVPDAIGVPPCLGAGQASRLTVRPFAAP